MEICRDTSCTFSFDYSLQWAAHLPNKTVPHFPSEPPDFPFKTVILGTPSSDAGGHTQRLAFSLGDVTAVKCSLWKAKQT